MTTLATSTEFKGVKINQFIKGVPNGYHVTQAKDVLMLTYYHNSLNYPTYYPYKATERQMQNQLERLFKNENLI